MIVGAAAVALSRAAAAAQVPEAAAEPEVAQAREAALKPEPETEVEAGATLLLDLAAEKRDATAKWVAEKRDATEAWVAKTVTLAAAEARENGNTQLHWAATTGRLETLRALLANEADPTVTDSKGRTPAFKAVLSTQESCAKELMKTSLNITELKKLYYSLVRLDNPNGVRGGKLEQYFLLIEELIEERKNKAQKPSLEYTVYEDFLQVLSNDSDCLQEPLNGSHYFPASVNGHAIGLEVVGKGETFSVTVFNRGHGSAVHDQQHSKRRVGLSYTFDQSRYGDLKTELKKYINKGGEKEGLSLNNLYKFLGDKGRKDNTQQTPFMRPQNSGSCATIWVNSYLKFLCYKHVGVYEVPNSSEKSRGQLKQDAEQLYLGIRMEELDDTINHMSECKSKIRNEETIQFLQQQQNYAKEKLERRTRRYTNTNPKLKGIVLIKTKALFDRLKRRA